MRTTSPLDPVIPSSSAATSRYTVGSVPAVAVGGAVGTLLRVALDQMLPIADGSLPIATLTANVLGAGLLGFIATMLLVRRPGLAGFAPLICTGLLGSFTTFSALSVQVLDLLAESPIIAGVYIALSIGLGLLAAWIGMSAARRFVPMRKRDRLARPDADRR